MEEKNRKINISDWFSDLDGSTDTPSTAHFPSEEEQSSQVLTQLEAPTQPRNPADFSIHPLLESDSNRAGNSPSGNHKILFLDKFIKKIRKDWFRWHDLSPFAGKILIALLIFVIVFGVIFSVTALGEQDRAIGSLTVYLYMLFILAIIPYLYFLVNPVDRQMLVLLFNTVLLGSIFFHLRLVRQSLSIAEFVFISQIFYLVYILVLISILLIGAWTQGKRKDKQMGPRLLWGIRIAYPVFLTGGALVIGLLNNVF